VVILTVMTAAAAATVPEAGRLEKLHYYQNND
jgi:hypothetical protein